jgi:hypothetical protein
VARVVAGKAAGDEAGESARLSQKPGALVVLEKKREIQNFVRGQKSFNRKSYRRRALLGWWVVGIDREGGKKWGLGWRMAG